MPPRPRMLAAIHAAQAAAERQDGAGQFRPVRMARPDAVIAAHMRDFMAPGAADHGGEFRGGRGQRPGPADVPPGQRPVVARATDEDVLADEDDERDEGMHQPLRQGAGRVEADPICIGGVGVGQGGERVQVAHGRFGLQVWAEC